MLFYSSFIYIHLILKITCLPELILASLLIFNICCSLQFLSFNSELLGMNAAAIDSSRSWSTLTK